MTDIFFTLSNTDINLRVTAVIRTHDHVLICRMPQSNTWYLPGGRIAVGESSRDALARELKEEITGQWTIHSPIASSENFFYRGDTRVQEFCTYYSVEWLGGKQDFEALSHEEFRWVPLNESDQFTIKPDFVKSLVLQRDHAMTHIIHHDREKSPMGVN